MAWDTPNALSVDVEDYFQVGAFKHCIDRSTWDSYPLRVEDNTRRILDLFDEFDARATFFVLGWVAERLPGLVRDIHARGHEVACHGYGHQLVYEIGPDAFRDDIARSRAMLQDITGTSVDGYRAPSYSITGKSLWALDILLEEGFGYDSSIFPIYHDTYGIPGSERFPHVLRRNGGELPEFPLTTWTMRLPGGRYDVPVAGGGYLRLLPAPLVRRAISSVNRVESQPAVLYFHPWEIDPDQPRVSGAGFKSRFRHYLNLSRTEAKLRHLLGRLPFAPMSEVLESTGVRHAA